MERKKYTKEKKVEETKLKKSRNLELEKELEIAKLDAWIGIFIKVGSVIDIFEEGFWCT